MNEELIKTLEELFSGIASSQDKNVRDDYRAQILALVHGYIFGLKDK